MAVGVVAREPVTVHEDERAIIIEIDRLLEDGQRSRDEAEAVGSEELDNEAPIRLVAPGGHGVALPASVVRLLHSVVHHLAHDRAVSIVPLHQQLTTQQAADLLNVSRPHLIGLLDRGEMRFTKTGTHRRVKFSDLMAYKHRRDGEEEAALDNLALMGEELGL